MTKPQTLQIFQQTLTAWNIREPPLLSNLSLLYYNNLLFHTAQAYLAIPVIISDSLSGTLIFKRKMKLAEVY